MAERPGDSEAAWQDLVAELKRDPELARLDEPDSPHSFADFDPLRLTRGGPRDYSVRPAEDAEQFVPEEPPGLPTFQPALVLAWAGIVLAPLAVVLAVMFLPSIPPLVLFIPVLLFIGSLAYLLYRLPKQRDDDDDGARL